MQHGLENTQKVEIKWHETDTNFDTMYYPVPLVYGNWIATRNGETVTAQEMHEAEDNIMLYVPDEMSKKCCKELNDWKESIRLAKGVIIDGYGTELDEKDEDFIMQVLYERGYLS